MDKKIKVTVFRWAGFSVGSVKILRASSPEKYGGNTSGVTLGWTW